MISFITWVNDPTVYEGFKASVSFPCEFVPVYEQVGSMAKAYNLGTARAKGDILIYCHQDVRIIDQLLPMVLEDCLQPNVGFAGPIGNLRSVNGSWWFAGDLCRGWVYYPDRTLNSAGKYNGPAAQLDGLMLCTRKRFQFPEQLPGIHFLDMWMCLLALKKGYTNWIFDCGVVHLSKEGNTSEDAYHANLKLFRRRWFAFSVSQAWDRSREVWTPPFSWRPRVPRIPLAKNPSRI